MFGSSSMFATQGASGFGGESQAVPATAPGGRQARVEEKMAALPVTIRSMEASISQRMGTGSELKFFGAEPSMLLLVAAVETVARSGTTLEMTVNDATGRIKARYFATEANPEMDRIVPGVYISAFGNVRTAPAVHFACTGVRVVENADEVSYHMIECAHSALKLATAKVASAESAAADPATPAKRPADAMASPEKPKMQVEADKAEPAMGSAAPPAAAAAPPAAPAAQAPAPSGADVRAGLLQLLRAAGDRPEGVNRSELVAKAAPAAESEVSMHLEALVNDGEIYSTIDDDHFAAV